MNGETSLNQLLASMSPVILAEEYVFCSLANREYGALAEAKPIASFQEKEGLTLVVTKQAADQLSLSYQGTFACISLTVHSSLEAVGLTAAIANALQAHNISANVIAAYYHDHVFVPTRDAKRAMAALNELTAK